MGLNQYELLIRSMTLELKVLKDAVKKVDEERYIVVGGFFARLGFKGDELEMRTRMFVTVMSQEENLLLDLPEGDRMKQMRLRHELLIRP